MKKIIPIIFIFGFLINLIPHITFAQLICCEIHAIPDNGQSSKSKVTEDQCQGYISQTRGVNILPIDTCDQEETTVPVEPGPSKPIAPQLSVSIPGFGSFTDVTCDDPKVRCQIPWIAEYIKAIYNYGLLMIGVLSVIVMMIGGIIRITAAGNRQQISQANSYISGSILGATIAICSYLILFLVNPNLVIWSPVNINYLEKIDLETLDRISDVVDAPTDNLRYPNVKTYDPKNEKPSTVSGCDDCVVTSLQTKNNKNVNKDLNAKLLQIKTNYDWRITEAYPPSTKHASKCHYNGRCVDIAVYPPTTDCKIIRQFINDVKATGLTILNEYTGCKGTQTKYGTGGHLHVRE